MGSAPPIALAPVATASPVDVHRWKRRAPPAPVAAAALVLPSLSPAKLLEGGPTRDGHVARPGEQVAFRGLAGVAHASLRHVDQPALPEASQLPQQGPEDRARAFVHRTGTEHPLPGLDSLQNLGVPLIHGWKVTIGPVGRDDAQQLVAVLGAGARAEAGKVRRRG